MEFRTKLDFSSNRQVKQYPETFTVLSGGTSFGVPFSALTTGPDLTTSAVTLTINGVVSTFSGNSGTTNYTWYSNSMSAASGTLSAWTLSNSGITQYAGPVFSASSTSVIDGNTVATSYSGVSFDLTPIVVIDLGGGNYSGSVYTDVLEFYSANTLDFTGRTIWVDVSGITRTERLIITKLGSGPGILDVGIDANGFLVNNASDIKLKENITPISNPLSKVLALNGVKYQWKDKNSGGYGDKLGFIAQNVETVVPELVYQAGEYKSVHYKDVTALLVEAIKELYSGGSISSVQNISTQTIVAEDNNIELNFGGSHETSIGGGIVVIKGVNDEKNSEFIIDENGNWVTNNSLIPKSLIIPEYTPTSSNDTSGNIGDLVRDDNYVYVKTKTGLWKRAPLETF